MGSLTRKLRRACAAALVVAGLLPAAGAAAPRERGWPAVDASGIQGLKLFDLGVADANGDGNLDIFTINHKFDSSFLLGTGAGTFNEATVPAGLSPTPAFPGFEAIRRDPAFATPGLYIYATDRDLPRDPLHIDAVGIPASGRLVFASEKLRVEDAGGAAIAAAPLPDGRTEVTFASDPGEQIDLSVDHIDLPIEVSIDPPTDPAQIRVGADAIPSSSRQFELNLRDRHGYAFGDYDSDGATDLFVLSGGLGGDIAEPFFTPLARDELLLSRGGRYENATASSGLVKGDCRGRGAEPGDIDGDGDIDLLASCELAAPRVYLGDGGGGFSLGPAPPAVGTAYRFADVVGGRRPELLAADGGRVRVWRYTASGWRVLQRLRGPATDPPIEHLSLGDANGDGNLDVYATSASGSVLLRSDGDRLKRVQPRSLGLPGASRAATFVDYDNDGDLDLHLMPQGLFRSTSKGFERTGRLTYPRAGLSYAIDNWADFDGDGRREPLTSRGRDEFAAQMTVELRRNTTRAGHWLALDLLGSPPNAQALGASARIRIGDRWIHQWVGQNDDARFSSGHYRLYFGLGDVGRARKLVVRWPDGTKTVRTDVRADRLIRIAEPLPG